MKILKRILLAAVCAILLAGLTMNMSSCSILAIYAITKAIASNDEAPNDEVNSNTAIYWEEDTLGTEGYFHEHCFDQENTDYQYIYSDANCTEAMRFYYSCSCGEVGWETFAVGEPLGHTYDQKIADSAYYVGGNKYYYSCVCGARGNETFYMGGDNSKPPMIYDGFTPISKTVFGLGSGNVHTTPDSGKNYCGEIAVADIFYIEATDGEWYKIQGTMFGYEYVYVRCEDVTDNHNKVCFNYVEENVTAWVKDGVKGAYLCEGLNDNDYVGYVVGGSYMDVISINNTGDWVLVCYVGNDGKGTYFDGSVYYYCPVWCLELVGLDK